MVIFVTDEGRIWNHENPVLEQYAECVIVVCLSGKQVTDKYKCIVCPSDLTVGLGMTDYSIQGRKYKALESVRGELRSTHSDHDNVVFLTDAEPQSLYPYLVLKDAEKYNRMHLWCMPPWRFEAKRRNDSFRELLHDIDKIQSLHYIDSNEFLKGLDRGTTLAEAVSVCRDWLNSMLPGALYEIETKFQKEERYFYDIRARRYITVQSPCEEIRKWRPLPEKDVENFSPVQKSSLLGRFEMPQYLDSDKKAKFVAEQLHPRVDGKKICDQLRLMRKAIADANGIEFKTVNCPSVGPCAGTCQQCDMELKYLQQKLEEMKEEDRIYPQFIVEEDKGPVSLCTEERSASAADFQAQCNTDIPMLGVPAFSNSSQLEIPAFLQKEPDRNE